MKKKALLLMPFFMGYEDNLKKALEKYYEVELVNNEKFWPNMNVQLSGTVIKRAVIKLSKVYANWKKDKLVNEYTQWYLKEAEKQSVSYDLIICINGQFLSNDFWKILRQKHPKAYMIMYLWDDASNLFKLCDLSIFDAVYSFNMDDCKKYGMKYLPMFVQGEKIDHRESKYDIAIIGTGHPDRIDFIKRVYEKYRDQFIFFIYIYKKNAKENFFTYDTPLPYKEYLSILAESRVVLDIPSIKQSGPTTRFFDALLTKTKVITTNQQIIQYPVYSNNIEIITRESPKISASFIYKDYENVDYECLSAKDWVWEIVKGEFV